MKSKPFVVGLFFISLIFVNSKFFVDGRLGNGLLIFGIFLQFIALGIIIKNKRYLKNKKNAVKYESKYKNKIKRKNSF